VTQHDPEGLAGTIRPGLLASLAFKIAELFEAPIEALFFPAADATDQYG